MKKSTISISPSMEEERFERHKLGGMENICLFISYIIVIIFLPFSLFFIYGVADQYERVVILRLGKLRKGGARGPGLFFILPCIDESTEIDMRTLVCEVDPQQVLTKDSCTIQINVIIFCRVEDPIKSVLAVADFIGATLNLASTTLRNIIGQKFLTQFLSDKDAVAKALKSVLDEGTHPWGIKVFKVEIMGITLPVSLQRTMASEAEAAREAKAKLVAAEGELLASRALTEASNVMIENPITIHLRYLQTLVSVSADRNNTIIFPLPTDIMRKYFQIYKKPKPERRLSELRRSTFSNGTVTSSDQIVEQGSADNDEEDNLLPFLELVDDLK